MRRSIPVVHRRENRVFLQDLKDPAGKIAAPPGQEPALFGVR